MKITKELVCRSHFIFHVLTMPNEACFYTKTTFGENYKKWAFFGIIIVRFEAVNGLPTMVKLSVALN